jgi:hypothetical protein
MHESRNLSIGRDRKETGGLVLEIDLGVVESQIFLAQNEPGSMGIGTYTGAEEFDLGRHETGHSPEGLV